MAENGAVASEDVEMPVCEGEKVVTMMDVLQEQQDFEDDANAVLGASDDKECTFSKGYIKRQAVYACLTCCSEAKTDESKRAGVCLACSLSCHENHELVELYTKRNFRCDCGNPKLNGHPCQFTQSKTELNEENVYNQNFSGLYCVCHRPYPDPEATFEDEMIQCIICEDWLHAAHLEATVPNPDVYAEMICKSCMDKNEFIHDYSEFAVNSLENGDVDVVNDSTVSNGLDKTNVDESKLDETLDKTDVDMSVQDKPSEKASLENEESSLTKNIQEDTKSVPETKPEDTELLPESKKEDSELIPDSKKEDSELIPDSKKEDPELIPDSKKEDPETVPEPEHEKVETISETNQEESVVSSETKDDADKPVTENNEEEDIIENKTENHAELDSNENKASETKDIENNTSEVSENVEAADHKPTENSDSKSSEESSTDANIDPSKESTTDASESDSKDREGAATVGEEKMNISEVDDKNVSEDMQCDKSDAAEAEDIINDSANNDKPIENGADTMTNGVIENNENKRKLPEEDKEEQDAKKTKYDECVRPKGVTKVYKGATFWPSNFRQKLCTCGECLAMYKDLAVLYLSDLEDTVTAYETLGKERTDGVATQYEKGLEALSSLDRIQQINALTEYNKMRDKLLDFLKSFKERKEVVKEEDIKAFFAGMKPKRESDGVYFCR